MKTIVLMKFGSHLYGTNTANSDTDYKGIFMPSISDVLSCTVQKSINNNVLKEYGQRNTKYDVDKEMYSLHYFIQLALNGDTAAIDMLHAPENMIIETSDIWKELQYHRSLFYSKSLASLTKYSRDQAAKYGMKGSRINAAQEFVDLLTECLKNTNLDRMLCIWSTLPINDHAYMIEDAPNGVKQYYICGRIVQSTQKIEYVHKMIGGFLTMFGQRAKLAAENKGIDWKAMSHALRAAYQMRELLQYGTITYPLKDADYLKRVKAGELDFAKNVLPELEMALACVDKLAKFSTLPEEPDRDFWGLWLNQKVYDHIVSSKSKRE